MRLARTQWLAAWAAVLTAVVLCPSRGNCESLRVRFVVTTDLSLPNTPMDPTIDFAALIHAAGAKGRLDPNSIQVVDTGTGETVPISLSSDFAYGDEGRVMWVIENPKHCTYEIRFRTMPSRPPLVPRRYVPPIGVGDLLRYNAGAPRPVALIYLSALADLTGDGKGDLVGCWNYAYAPGEPWSGIFCYPRVGDAGKFLFGGPIRLRYRSQGGSADLKFFSQVYMQADVADLNGDGLLDIVYSPKRGDKIFFYLNSGERDAAGMPVFVRAGEAPRGGEWDPCRAVDLNGDGTLDFVVGQTYLRNTNAKGWPINVASPVKLDVGRGTCFLDLDGDGRLDAVCLVDGEKGDPRARVVAWRKNLGSDPPRFGPAKKLDGVDAWWCCSLAAVGRGKPKGLLVGHNVWQNVSYYECVAYKKGKPVLQRLGRAESVDAVIALSDQAWPCFCDWDDDGDLDMLVGGGYGWPRILINEGTRTRPAFAEPKPVLAKGKPIRILRNDVLGGEHWHNMGYLYPAFVDWDGDGLQDLMLPNETNRIFWYKNIGTRRNPKFGKRRQLICDGYPDSPEKRARSARLAADKNTPNAPYPYEKDRPFFWRTGAGFADLNGDGLMDLITHDGYTRKLTLFTQYRDGMGKLHLRKNHPLRLVDGRLIDDSIVGRASHWTESFRCVDWNKDGLVDIVYACAGSSPSKGSIYLLLNCGTKSEPKFRAPVTFCCFGKPIYVTAHGPHPWAGDFDGDGYPDLVACVEWSVYPFYRYAALTMRKRPAYKLSIVRKSRP